MLTFLLFILIISIWITLDVIKDIQKTKVLFLKIIGCILVIAISYFMSVGLEIIITHSY